MKSVAAQSNLSAEVLGGNLTVCTGMHCRSVVSVSATGRDILGHKKSHGKKSHKKPIIKTIGGPANKGGEFYNNVHDPSSHKKDTAAVAVCQWGNNAKGRFWV